MKSILLIDDDPFYSAMLKKVLENLGYQVRALTSPEAALDETDCHSRYSHLLIDFQFKHSPLTGEQVGQTLRWRWPLLPIVLITAYMQQENARMQYLSVGWDGSWDKAAAGVASSELGRKWNEVLDHAQKKAEERLQRDFPVSEQDYEKLFQRLEALEKAYIHNAGKSGNFSERELTQAASIFLSTGADTLTKDNLDGLKAFRGTRMNDRTVWEGTGVKMTTQNNWSAFFRIREESTRNELGYGKMIVNGFVVRRLIMQNPGQWFRTCSQYGPVIKVVKEFGLSSWAQRKPPVVADLHAAR